MESMGCLKTLALAGALASVTASGAFAGDLPLPAPAIPEAPPEASVGDDSGIYLRGDIGVGINMVDSLRVDPTGDFDSLSIRDRDITESYFVGAGVGYALNSWLRFDVTGEWRAGARVTGRDFVTFDGGTDRVVNIYDGGLSSAVVMANAYVDLGTFCQLGCITPYVGAGVGYAFHWMTGLKDTGVVTIDDGAGGVFPSAGYGNAEDSDFAWALMAGFAYQVNDKLTLDLGYRYLNMGDGPETSVINADSGSNDGSVQWRGLTSHDIRLGMRWTLNGDCCAAAEPAPLMRKY
jgi:opacity protein-like surface antigen